MQTLYMLTGEQNWPIWYNHIKSKATKQRIWEYMNPKVNIPTPLSSMPYQPQYSNYRANTTSYTHLDEKDQKNFSHNYEMWKELTSNTNLILERYDSMDSHLFNTVASHLQLIIMNKESPYDKLKALSVQFTKNPYTNIQHLYQRWYNYLIKTPYLQNLDTWILNWEGFLTEVQDIGEPRLEARQEGYNTILCFLNTIHPLNTTWVSQVKERVQDGGRITIYHLLDHYQTHLQAVNNSDSTSEAAYTTLGNLSTNQQSSNRQNGLN